MPPTSDGVRTVGCSLEKLVPLPEHIDRIRSAVSATHKATILATELLNMHLRKCLEQDPTQDLSSFFNGSWLLNAYNEVTYGKRSVKVVPELRATKMEYMPHFNAPDRTGIQQCLLYDARNLATVAATTIWLHFQPRVLSHVRRVFDIEASEYSSLSKEEKRKHKLEVLQVASDMCQLPSQPLKSPPSYHEWIASERKRLYIIDALTAQENEPFLYQLKARPHRFLYPLYLISKEREANEKGAFCLYPVDLNTFCAYCGKRHETMEMCLLFYSMLGHRRRRWKTNIKTQQSEERLYKKVECLKTDKRQLVLAYGSRGLIAGKAGVACNKGNPLCVGVGLMRKLSKSFLLVPTPEAYTSKTCSKCFGECGPCIEKEEDAGKKIRGLRRCTQRDCMLLLNRDKMGLRISIPTSNVFSWTKHRYDR